MQVRSPSQSPRPPRGNRVPDPTRRATGGRGRSASTGAGGIRGTRVKRRHATKRPSRLAAAGGQYGRAGGSAAFPPQSVRRLVRPPGPPGDRHAPSVPGGWKGRGDPDTPILPLALRRRRHLSRPYLSALRDPTSAKLSAAIPVYAGISAASARVTPSSGRGAGGHTW